MLYRWPIFSLNASACLDIAVLYYTESNSYLIRKFYSYIVVNKLWLALERYIPMLWGLGFNGSHTMVRMLWLALHVFDVMLVRTPPTKKRSGRLGSGQRD